MPSLVVIVLIVPLLWLSERKCVSLYAGIKKLNLEQAIHDGLRLPDELIEPVPGDAAVSLLVDVDAMRCSRCAAVKQHAEAHRRSGI